MKKILMISILVLTACSSPPEPPQVEWEKMPEVMNTQIMNWKPTSGVIKSDNINSPWSKVLPDFKPENH
ncbi:cag pathogenicity island Cag12 family protein, partial [Salmonella enterica subsp. enterica serovar Infantis]